MPQQEELGGPIYDVKYKEDLAFIKFGKGVEKMWKDDEYHNSMPFAPKGAHVWKTADAEIGKRMRRLADLEPSKIKSSAKVVVEGKVGKPLTIRIIDESSGKVGVADSSKMGVLEEATGSALSSKSIGKAVGTLGGSEFSLSALDLDSLDDAVWCPISWIKDVRRRALENLRENTSDSSDVIFKNDKRYPMTPYSHYESIVDRLLDEIATSSDSVGAPIPPKISVLARTYEQ
eukprot:scaffold114528_cov45-Cyclotella_meneghiniana.AAC.1